MCNTNNYDPAIIAEKIKKECVRQNITVKTMLQELNINKDVLYKMTHGARRLISRLPVYAII